MLSYTQLTEALEQTVDLRSLVEVYEETAAEKMKQIRKRILSSREFLEALTKLSSKVGADLTESFTVKKKQEAAVLMSAKAGLFGDLIERIVNQWLSYVKENRVEPVVVGALGKRLVEERSPSLRFEYLDLEDKHMPEEDLKELSLKLNHYPKVRVFYAKFENIASQEVVNGDVTGLIMELQQEISKEEAKRSRYIYEPSVNVISDKIGKEIMTSLVGGMAEENQLSKYASRLLHLDRALDKIDEQLGKLRIDQRQADKQIQERKQQERVIRRKFI